LITRISLSGSRESVFPARKALRTQRRRQRRNLPRRTGNTGYTIRQAAYDLRKLRGKELITKPGRTRRYHLTPRNAGTIASLLTLREQVIGPILAGVRSPRMGRKPITWTAVDRDYEKIRIDMQTLFRDLGIRAAA
jgi:hypothetical protein